MSLTPDQIQRSTAWLKENFAHIWAHPQLLIGEKAGFLASACNPHRCALMTLSLVDRINVIRSALAQDGFVT